MVSGSDGERLGLRQRLAAPLLLHGQGQRVLPRGRALERDAERAGETAVASRLDERGGGPRARAPPPAAAPTRQGRAVPSRACRGRSRRRRCTGSRGPCPCGRSGPRYHWRARITGRPGVTSGEPSNWSRTGGPPSRARASETSLKSRFPALPGGGTPSVASIVAGSPPRPRHHAAAARGSRQLGLERAEAHPVLVAVTGALAPQPPEDRRELAVLPAIARRPPQLLIGRDEGHPVPLAHASLEETPQPPGEPQRGSRGEVDVVDEDEEAAALGRRPPADGPLPRPRTPRGRGPSPAAPPGRQPRRPGARARPPCRRVGLALAAARWLRRRAPGHGESGEREGSQHPGRGGSEPHADSRPDAAGAVSWRCLQVPHAAPPRPAGRARVLASSPRRPA